MTRARRLTAVALTALALPACAAADSPTGLAQRMQKAVAAKDVDAFASEFDQLAALTGLEQYAALNLVRECQESACTFSVGPLTPEVTEKLKRDPEMEPTAQPEGVIVFSAKSADGTGEMSGNFPYAKLASGYKIVGARLKADHLAKLKATTAQAATDEKLAKGIGGDPAWKSQATPLPADGGEPGQAFLAEVKAIGAAVKAKDVDAAAKAGGGWNQRVFGATNGGKPVPLATRQLALRVQSPRIIVDARILGGYVNGDHALLIIEGTNGAGNTLKGPLVMSKSFGDGSWQKSDHFGLIEIPKGL
jgi:hypothetical protein